ncbi:MAG: electron transfer flavoprotein subunit alpha/FixB family protein [FCB group bacterium]|jgi:electron transfer flavoprotein alpha subunit
MKNGIIVLVEHLNGAISEISYELLGAGRLIADNLNIPLGAVIIGKDVKQLCSGIGIADNVFVIEDEDLEVCNPAISACILKQLIEQKEISYVLLGGTNISVGTGPLLASALKYPFINFCKHIRIDNSQLVVTSQLFGGKILSDMILDKNKGIISIYPGSFPIESGKTDKAPNIEVFEAKLEEIKCKFSKYIEPEAGDVDITKQDVLVSVGRGIENADNIGMAEDLIALLGGAVCASRPVIDQGWLPLSRQVGKSGMIVKPKLYLALGISGAPEHVEGMKDSELIIAINKDPDAPIFNIAHYGICADINDIIPALMESIKKRKN